MRLLLIEDEEQFGRGIQKALQRDGDQVACGNSFGDTEFSRVEAWRAALRQSAA